jgi:hypothetical protein
MRSTVQHTLASVAGSFAKTAMLRRKPPEGRIASHEGAQLLSVEVVEV